MVEADIVEAAVTAVAIAEDTVMKVAAGMGDMERVAMDMERVVTDTAKNMNTDTRM